MQFPLTESAILEFLHQIENGEISLKAISNPEDVYAGDVTYHASNGWQIVVFNDANTWDYLDSIKIDEDHFIDYDELDKMIAIRNYSPPLEVIQKVYGIPQVEGE
jgi:uncharacterized protein YuzE